MLMPTTEWVAPTEFPDLRKADEIAIDLETRDRDLKKLGSGAIIGNGEVIGIAVAVDGYKNYFPIGAWRVTNVRRSLPSCGHAASICMYIYTRTSI